MAKPETFLGAKNVIKDNSDWSLCYSHAEHLQFIKSYAADINKCENYLYVTINVAYSVGYGACGQHSRPV